MRTVAIVVFLFVLICAETTAVAQDDNRYSTWSDPAKSSADGNADAKARLDDMIDQLNKLVDEAEKSRAADPVFLQDLRALANGDTRPWTATLLDDAFADGNFSANPKWEVLSGEYFIEQGWGLRNRILTSADETQSSSSGVGGDEFAKVLLGTILKKAAGVENKTGPVENVIVTRTRISNAFAVTVEVSSWVPGGHLELGVFQGDKAVNGYRVLYVSGKGVQLHRVGGRGASVVETSADPVTLEDKKSHTIVWTRDSGGAMTISVDGKSMINVTDRAFSDVFDGLRFSNRTGDFIIKHVLVEGV